MYVKGATPPLPAAGGSLVDPVFGNTIFRVTSPSNAADGAVVNSSPVDSMFNADGTLAYVHHCAKRPTVRHCEHGATDTPGRFGYDPWGVV